MTDWNSEADKLGSSDFWKPGTGTFKVKFLDDGVPDVFESKDGKKTEQMVFTIEVNGEQKKHYVTKAKTVNSLWGQLALLGRYHGTLEGREFTYIVKFDEQNNKREYTIHEALPLIEEWNKQKNTKEAPNGASDSSKFLVEQVIGGVTAVNEYEQ